MKKASILSIIWLLIFNVLVVFPYRVYADDYEEESDEDLELIETVAPTENELKLGSRRAIVYERNTGTVLYEKNANERVPMASTTKIATATVVLENAEDLNKVVTISKKAASIGGSVIDIKAGDKITIHDLLCGLLIKSGNNAGVALAEEIGGSVEGFAEIMNKKALEMGLRDTHFVTPHGLDSDEHYTTARELALMTDYALKIPKFKEIVGTSSYNLTVNGETRNINNTNELLGYLKGVYGVKTGFTNKAGRCLVTATKRGDMDIICVVLGADTKKIRSQDSMKLIEYAFENYKVLDLKEKIAGKLQELNGLENYISVIKGKEYNVTPRFEGVNTLVTVRNEDIPNIRVEVNYVDFIEAPVMEGTIVGNISAKIDEEVLVSQNICVEHNIEKKGIYEYLSEMLTNYNKYVNCTLQMN